MKKIVCAVTIIMVFFPSFQTGSSDVIENIINEVKGDILFEYVQTLQDFGEHVTGSAQCEEVAKFIHDEFEKWGLDVRYHEWSSKGYTGKNVVAVLQGRTNASVMVSAHYDSYPTSPGADDDGSGIACLLLTAKILSTYKFEHTITFIAFSGEEQGMLGSKAYVRYLYERGDDILADINVDTVGHAVTREGGELIRVITDEASVWITDVAEEICERYHSTINLELYRHGNFPAGDHQSFINYGYEAVFFVEYEFNPDIHTANDVIDNINKSYLTNVCKLVSGTVAKIADMTFTVRVKFTEPERGCIYFNDRKIVSLQDHHSLILGRIHASAACTSSEHIKRVEFYFDGEVDGFYSSPPYAHRYDSIAFFEHSLKAVALSDSDSDISTLTVVVFNMLPPGPPHDGRVLLP